MQTRNVIRGVNWECDIRTLFHEVNLGVGLGMKTAIDWVFENEEQAIILEDDCIPDPTFFRFCSELLQIYQDDETVMCINGSSVECITEALKRRGYSYGFSRYGLPWGWATWKTAWTHFDFRMAKWPKVRESGQLRSIAGADRRFEAYWKQKLESTYVGDIDTWDYQWRLAMWLREGLAITPQINMIENRGFGPSATHTHNKKDRRARRHVGPTEFPLIHPRGVERSNELDLCLDKEWFGFRGRWRKVKDAISKR